MQLLTILVALIVSITAQDLNVFLLPHSHCDAGWIKTFEQYYETEVVKILDSVTAELTANPTYKFNWAEIGFFKRWWQDASSDQKSQFTQLLNEGRIEFICGGWVQNDEAVTEYHAIIQQMTEGHLWLKATFGDIALPRVGWQIDPFGHTSSNAMLFAEMGFDMVVIDRMGFYHKVARQNNQSMEYIWETVMDDEGTDPTATQIFTHILDRAELLYDPPVGFDFESKVPFDAVPVTTDNVVERAQVLQKEIEERAKWFRTKNLLILFGMDFRYQNASIEFNNMTMVINEINSHPHIYNMKIQYATMSDFLDAINADQGKGFPHFQGDWVPYKWTPDNDSYWSGFYTSHPTLKGRVRRTDSMLRTAQVNYVLAYSSSPSPSSDLLQALSVSRQNSGILEHHDAVTGTEKSFVVDDYNSMLNDSVGNLTFVLTNSTSSLLNGKTNPQLDTDAHGNFFSALERGQVGVIVLTNPLAVDRTELISVPVPRPGVGVIDKNLQPVVSQIVTNNQRCKHVAGDLYTLYFQAQVKAFGFTTYYVQVSTTELAAKVSNVVQLPPHYLRTEDLSVSGCGQDTTFTIKNDALVMTFRNQSGTLCSLTETETGRTVNASFGYFRYTAKDDSAYFFRPVNEEPNTLDGFLETSLVTGPVVQQVHQVWTPLNGPEICTSISLSAGSTTPQAVLTHAVDTLPEDCELIWQFATELDSQGKFTTDTNGLNLMERTYNSSIPLPGNYYPSVAHLSYTDRTQNLTAAHYFTQSHGVTLRSNNTLEVMLHRRLSRTGLPPAGLNEPLNDTTPVIDVFGLDLAPSALLADRRRTLQLRMEFPVFTLYSSSPDLSYWATSFSLSSNPINDTALPPAIHIQALEPTDFGQNHTVLRLHHLYQPQESSAFSQPFTVDLYSIFNTTSSGIKISGADERMISLVRPSSYSRLKWLSDETTMEKKQQSIHKDPPKTDLAYPVTLYPMQTRSFFIYF